MAAQRGEERLVGGRRMERLARGADHADSPARQEQRDRAAVGVELAGDDLAEPRALLGVGPQERDLRIVRVECPPRDARRHRRGLAEVHHVETARRHDRGDAEAPGRLQPGGPGAQDSPDQLVRPFRGGDVEDPGDESAVDERLHRAPTGAGGVEHEHLVARGLDEPAGLGDAGGGVAEHAGHDDRAVHGGPAAPSLGGRHHPVQRARGVFEDCPGNPIQPCDIDDRGDHDEVGRADVRRGLAAGER